MTDDIYILKMRFRESKQNAKNFIKKFKELNKVKEIKKHQILQDVETSKRTLKLTFKEWLKEHKKIQNLKGVGLK